MNNQIDILFTKAYQLQSKGELSQAISLYKDILIQEPQHQKSLHFLGLAYAQQSDIDNAIFYLLQAKEIKSDAGLLNNLANAYKKKGNVKEAINYYHQAIELKPDYAQAHNNLAILYDLNNEYQKALSHYSKAVNLEPDFSAAHFNLGLLLLKNNQLVSAKIQFNNVLSLNPNHLEAQFYLGILHLETNALAEAEDAFQNVLRQDHEHVETRVNLGVIALKKQENQLAVDYFSKALALDNEHIDARNNLAATFMHHDRFENALMHYDVLLKKDPDNIEYLYNSGVAEMALGHLNEAVLYFERIITLDKDHASSLNNLAAIYLKMEMRETAKEYLEKALVINPEDEISQHMLHALKGAANAHTTPEYAQNLFNNYALNYDQHMQGQLHYAIPQHIGRIIHQLNITDVSQTLDLGCGTGLTGIVLREISKHLTGIDIAEKMLAQAKNKGIYDVLIQDELMHFLTENQQRYDLISAADVLPYFGDLNPLFQAIKTHLNPDGYFIFTTEINETTPWVLESSARFSHQIKYIKNLIEHHQLQLVKQEQIPARLQNNLPVHVMLYVGRNPKSLRIEMVNNLK